MDDDFEFCFDGFDYDAPEPVREEHWLTDEDILKWSSWAKPFPLPHHLVPTEAQTFEEVSDDVLLDAPPHLIAHIHRTAAQGGLQVVSPRQTPITSTMVRVKDPKRDLGDHVVGSVAPKNLQWPTLDDFNFSDLLPDEPLAPSKDESTIRTKTKTEPLTKMAGLASDPILSCLIKGRAVIDLQQRDDVMGDADGLTDILAKAWGIQKSELMDMDAFTLAIDGPLLRHSIKSDDVYPMVHAPIHLKQSISVGSTEVTRDMLPEDSAIDWRRCRVFCEAVFLLTCAIEGYPLMDVRCIPPPGDPTAPLTRSGILAFRPAPCIAWSHEPKSFSVFPTRIESPERISQIPRDVLDSLANYVSLVRPMSHAMSLNHNPQARKTIASEEIHVAGETIQSSYRLLVTNIQLGGGRGKTAARAVRSFIFDAIEQAPLHTRLRMSRYMRIARTECRIHLNTVDIPELLIDRLATKFLKIGDLIRTRVVAECARRGSSVEEWWNSFISQAPYDYKMMNEGTMGWAKVAMWILFKAPTEKWENLEKAVHYSALREAEVGAISGVPLPPVKGSMERILAASQAMVKQMTSAYSGYYMAVCDVAMCIGDVLDSMKRPRSAAIMREGAFLWCLRARSLRGTNVHPIEKTKPTPSQNHLRVFTDPVDILIVPAPYRPFKAYQSHVSQSVVLHKSVIQVIKNFTSPKISEVFHHIGMPMANVKESIITRYLADPDKLGSAMEKSWRDLTSDVRRVVDIYGHGGREMSKGKRQEEESYIELDEIALEPLTKRPKQPGFSYYDLIGEADPDEVDWMEDVLSELEEAVSDEIQERQYESIDELRRTLLKIEEEVKSGNKPTLETVR